MARAEVTVRTIAGSSQFAKAARKKGAEITRRRLDALAADAVAATNQIVKNEYTQRFGKRRHILGPHLLGSFHCTVRGDDFPFQLRLASRASACGS